MCEGERRIASSMSSAVPDELAGEQRHLDATWSVFERLLRALVRRGRTGVDDFADEALERMRAERIRVYTSASGPLYFGRIDRVDGGVLYIGRHAIADERNELLAINWRAPAAAPFYAATRADHHGLTRRRRLDVEERRVLGYVDETLSRADGDEVLTDAIIDDITRQRVGEMRQIISTITPEQYELITEPAAGALVIQGGPGTGKTAVGLHRAAWLLYSDRDLARHGVLIVGPNDVFISYIGQVLPSLGETAVEQRSAEALATVRARRGAEPEDIATLKGSGAMAQVLRRLLWSRVRVPGEETAIAVQAARVALTPGDLRRLIDVARESSRSYQRARERFRDGLAGLVASRLTEQSRTTLAATQGELMTLVRKTSGYQRLATRVWPRVTAEQLFGWLFTGRPRLTAAADGLLDASAIDLLQAAGKPAAGTLSHGDVALLDEAHWLVDADLRTYGHVVIDEAQNLTAMELRMVVRRARGQSLTVLGDIAQRTAEARLRTWSEVLSDAGAARLEVRNLRVSYRVPDDFLRIASAVSPRPAERPVGVRRAPWPAVAVRADEGELTATAARLARALSEAAGSVAIVVPDRWQTPLAAEIGVDAEAAGHLSGGVDVVGLRTVKGLEFDGAVVVEPAEILHQRPDGGPGGLYTALTRSTRALAIVHARALPAALAGADDLDHLDADTALARLDGDAQTGKGPYGAG
jgi:DNA helicase IV